MKFKDLSYTFHTEKIKECVEFYTQYLGAKVSFDACWYVSVHLQSDVNPYLYISFQGSNGEMVRNTFSGGMTINLMLDDVDAAYEKLKQAGLTFFEEITDHEWGDRAFSVLDPIGNIVYIYSVRELHDKYKSAVKE